MIINRSRIFISNRTQGEGGKIPLIISPKICTVTNVDSCGMYWQIKRNNTSKDIIDGGLKLENVLIELLLFLI